MTSQSANTREVWDGRSVSDREEEGAKMSYRDDTEAEVRKAGADVNEKSELGFCHR